MSRIVRYDTRGKESLTTKRNATVARRRVRVSLNRSANSSGLCHNGIHEEATRKKRSRITFHT